MRKQAVLELGVGAAWLFGLAAAVRLIEVLVPTNPLLAAVVGAVVVDLGATRAGVRWDGAPESSAKSAKRRPPAFLPETSWRPWAREIAFGGGLALLVIAVALGVSILAGWAHVERGGLVAGLAYGGARAAAVGVRDELLFRGLVLFFASRAGLPRGVALAYAALAGSAAIAFVPGASVAALITTAAAGLAFGALWVSRRGAVAAVAAHVAWNLFAGAGLHGAILDAVFARGDLGDGARAAGFPAIIAAGAWIVVAALLLRRGERRNAGHV